MARRPAHGYPRSVCPIALLDAQYDDTSRCGRVACAIAESWEAAEPTRELVLDVNGVMPYRPGQFFERELPGLLRILEQVAQPLDAIIVDGYVVLDENGSPGLGGHLHEALGRSVPVIGIAKRPYRGSEFAEKVLRGESRVPLFVTARGISAQEAAVRVRSMHGAHRTPTLAKRVDHLARGLAAPADDQASSNVVAKEDV